MGCFIGVCVLLKQGSWLFRPVLAHRHATGKTLSKTCTARSVKGCAASPVVGSCQGAEGAAL